MTPVSVFFSCASRMECVTGGASHSNVAICSGVRPEHSYGECRVNRAASIGPRFAGGRVGGGSASAVVDVCVATHMRGLVPHDRVCEMRSGADLWRRPWPPMRLL